MFSKFELFKRYLHALTICYIIFPSDQSDDFSSTMCYLLNDDVIVSVLQYSTRLCTEADLSFAQNDLEVHLEFFDLALRLRSPVQVLQLQDVTSCLQTLFECLTSEQVKYEWSSQKRVMNTGCL